MTENISCNTCASNSGEKRISPGPTIYEGVFWLVEHAYPTKLKGWLVITTKKHVESLHELSSEAFHELGLLMGKTTKILHEVLDSEKEYAMCLGEIEGFHHIHFHIVPKSAYLPEEYKGSKIFAMLKIPREEAVPEEVIKEFCEELQKKY